MPPEIRLSIPNEFIILEDDLIYVVTGYNKSGAALFSRETSIQNLRKYLVKIEGISGIKASPWLSDNSWQIYSNSKEGNLIDINYGSVYPHEETISTTGLNTRTENLIVRDFDSSWPYSGIIYNTGLNAVVGNNMEIQFSSETSAANKFGSVGGKYHSGIISTTGLNARTENLIVREFESNWPHSGVIYNTGLNAIVGNNMEIQFSSSTPAANKFGGVGSKYYSGIISTTGLNARTENLIVHNFESSWPYSGIIYNTGLNAKAGNNIEIDFSTNRHLSMGAPYYSGTISTTGLNMIASTGIQYQISTTWPHKYIVSQLDLKVVANNTFTYGPTTSSITVVDNQLYRNIDWSLSNSKPLIDNSAGYCYIVEFFINSFTLSNVTLPSTSPESRGRPTEFNGSEISWSTCNTIITAPATVTIGMNGNNIININPSSNPTYNASNSTIYLRYIEKRNLNSAAIVQPRYTIVPASYYRECTGTYQVWVPVTDNPSYPEGGYFYTAFTSWGDNGNLETTLSVNPYRHLTLDFSELVS